MASLSAFAKRAIGTVARHKTVLGRIENLLRLLFVKCQLPHFDFFSVNSRFAVALCERWLGRIIGNLFGGFCFRFGSFFLRGGFLFHAQLFSRLHVFVDLQGFLSERVL